MPPAQPLTQYDSVPHPGASSSASSATGALELSLPPSISAGQAPPQQQSPPPPQPYMSPPSRDSGHHSPQSSHSSSHSTGGGEVGGNRSPPGTDHVDLPSETIAPKTQQVGVLMFVIRCIFMVLVRLHTGSQDTIKAYRLNKVICT